MGIPPRYCRRVSELTGICLKRLRPHDWADYWSEVEADGLPGASQLPADCAVVKLPVCGMSASDAPATL